MRLATLETISELKPIPNADSIELAIIGGWECIVKKEEFTINEMCIYVPPDTLVDTDKEYFSFLASKSKTNLVRIKPTKIRGVWSEGLLLKISNFPKEISDVILNEVNSSNESDFGELLGVTKYNKDIVYTQIQGVPGQKTSTFPEHIISKTDEDSLKNNKKLLREFINLEIYISKKMDGSSMTLILKESEFMVCSRNIILDIESVMYQYVIRENLEEKIRNLINFNIAIQGEFCGPKVNGNKMGLKDYDFYVFNVKNLDTNTYYSLEELKLICNLLNIKLVPILFEGLFDETFDMDYFKNMANNVKYKENSKDGEGIVIRPKIPIYSNSLRKNLSCKVINQNYKD